MTHNDQRIPKGELAMYAERQIIGAVLQDPKVLDGLPLVPEDFVSGFYRMVFEAYLALRLEGKLIDFYSTVERLKPKMEGDNWQDRLSDAVEICLAPTNAPLYAERVKTAAMVRRAEAIMGEGITGLREKDIAEAGSVIDVTIRGLMELSRVNEGFTYSLREMLSKAMEHLDEISSRGGLPGITTGLKDLDGILGGLHRSDLYVVGARPAMGKTAMMLNMALSAAKAGVPVGIVSTEQPAEQLALRFLSIRGDIDAGKIRTADLNDHEWRKLTNTAKILMGEARIWVHDRPSIRWGNLAGKPASSSTSTVSRCCMLTIFSASRQTIRKSQDMSK